MIVYYDPVTFDIKGMSYSIDSNRQEPYVRTEDPLAEKIFLGQEKSIKYIVVVNPGPAQRGIIKPRPSKNVTVVSISDTVHKISKDTEFAEVTVLQSTSSKLIKVTMSSDLLEWWKLDPNYSKRNLHITACSNSDPYKPMWTRSISPDRFSTDSTFNYTGDDNFVLYTVKLFDGYKHEITSI